MLLLEPYAFAATPSVSGSAGAGSGAQYMATPSPREVWLAGAAGTTVIDVDLGSARPVGGVYVGFTNAAAGATWRIQSGTGLGSGLTDMLPNGTTFRHAENSDPLHPGFAWFQAPVTTRYVRVTIVQSGAALQIGSLAIGAAIERPHELNGGRGIVDTGSKEALPDGGFGTGDGVVKAAVRWTYSDIGNADLRALWAFAKRRGERRPIVAIEYPTDAPVRSEEAHYGLFDKFEAYTREDPDATRWAMSMTEWA